MRFKKIAALVASAVMAASVFAVNAGALGYIYPAPYKYDVGGDPVYGSITDYIGNGNSLTGTTINITMPYGSGAPAIYPNATGLYTALSTTDLQAVKDNNLTLNYTIETIANYGANNQAVTYTTSISKSNMQKIDPVTGLVTDVAIPSGGVDPILSINPGSSTDVNSFTIQCTSLGGMTLKYNISWAQFDALKTLYGVPTTEDTFYSYTETDGSTVIKKIAANTDAVFELTGGRVLTFSYNTDDYYYSKAETLKQIREKILKSLGYTDAQIADETNNPLDNAIDKAIKSYVDNAVTELSDKLFNADGTSKYATAADVENIINNYFYETDSTGALTAAATKHREDLAAALLSTQKSQDAIEDAVYSIFGDSTTPRQKENLINAIWKDLVDKTVKQLLGTNTLPSGYASNIDYFLSAWSTDALTQLKTEVDAVKERLKDSNGNDLSLTDILAKIAEVKAQLTTTGGKEYTIADILQAIADAQKAATNAGSSAAETALADAKNYVNNQGYATQSDLYSTSADISTQLAQLRNRILTLETQLSSLQNSTPQSFTSWVNYQYGSLDSFITEVANKVAQKLGYGYNYNNGYYYRNGTSGESAYDIAVRNGFRGTEQAWLNSLVGASAYEIAVEHGFKGSEVAWLNSLKGEDGKDGKDGEDGKDGKDGKDGRDGRDGDEGKVIYIYGGQQNASAPVSAGNTEDSEEINPGAGTGSNAAPNTSYYGTTGNSNAAPANASRTKNPATGVAAGIIIPAAAAASVFLMKKDKRRRGRK